MPKLETFVALFEANLYKAIIEIGIESCEIDIIPAKPLNRVLKHCIPPLNKIINLSLGTGKFNEGWKSTVVRSLIKPLQKGKIQRNERQVSNLTFISKIVKIAL